MKYQGRRQSKNVQDRRGRGGGPGLGMAGVGGGLGLIIFIIVSCQFLLNLSFVSCNFTTAIF